MFELFNGVSDGELKGIYKDILKSEKDGLRPKSLDSYAKKLQKICKFVFAINRFYEGVIL